MQRVNAYQTLIFQFVSNRVKTQKISIKSAELDPWPLYDVTDHIKTKIICDAVVSKGPSSLQYVSGWFVIKRQVKICHDGDDYYSDNEIVEQYDDYKKC